MTSSETPSYHSKLSHSARALLKTLGQLQQKQNPDLFQPDPQVTELQKMVFTYKGSIISATEKRLQRILERGGVSIITQDDLMGIVRDLWESNISRMNEAELKVLEGTLKDPEANISELAGRIKQSYSKTRRAIEHLRLTGILKREGRLDAAQMGLDRVLIIMENPSGILNSPYFTRFLFSDGAIPRVFIKGLVPSARRKDFMQTIRALRTVSDSTSVWALSSGEPRFGRTSYYNSSKKKFEFDPLHFRLLLRNGGEELVVGSFPISYVQFPKRFNASDIKIIEQLIQDFDITAQQLVERTEVSESTAFRRRQRIIGDQIVHPRPKILIPSLSDHVVGIFSADAASRIIDAWARLPLTYVSQVTNLEDTKQKKIIFATALPTGAAPRLIDVLESEMSRVDDYQAYQIHSGTQEHLPVSALYDTREKKWLFNASYFDVRNYSSCRKEADRKNIPLDLA
jgi:DNA-binding Lrp family transcriptional regulator